MAARKVSTTTKKQEGKSSRMTRKNNRSNNKIAPTDTNTIKSKVARVKKTKKAAKARPARMIDDCRSINYLITRLPAAYRLHARHPASRKHLLKLIVRCNANPASLITAARVLHAVCNIQPCHLEAWQAHVVGEQWGFERHAAGWRRPELMRLLLAAALKISCNYHDDFTPDTCLVWVTRFKAAHNARALAYTERQMLRWIEYDLCNLADPAILRKEAQDHGVGVGPCHLGEHVGASELDPDNLSRRWSWALYPRLQETLGNDHRYCHASALGNVRW